MALVPVSPVRIEEKPPSGSGSGNRTSSKETGFLRKYLMIQAKVMARGVLLGGEGDQGLDGEESLFRGVKSLIKWGIN